MPSLAPALRKKLEDAVKEARDVAEAGALAALEQLAVHAAEPFGHLGPDDRELRTRLRARARQLGDTRDARTGAHQISHLVVECAYEHWHRMLFARFLAENGVLIAHSAALGIDNTPVTLEECEELAADEGAANGWELAGRYASRMLPQIFRPDAPVLAVHLPPEHQRKLEQLLAELAPETFKASDALGWVYQFWQAKKKQQVNDSGVKIGADELPAVTQLFTEPYMVEFLLHNTLGAWWAGKVLAERPELARTAQSEDELRAACALPGYAWTYLRFVQDDGSWRPAAGTFAGWPKTAAALKVLDPCCGSGHFLVAAHEILVSMRVAEEGLAPADACAEVLRDNLHGLEIDERCTQIAAFALALAAWTFPGTAGYRDLPDLHIACSGLAPRAKLNDWLALAGDTVRFRNGMERLFELFRDAPVRGSLIDPASVGYAGRQRELGVARFEDLREMLEVHARVLEPSPDSRELGVAASGLATAAGLLASLYTLVITNVPYLARLNQSQELRDALQQHYPLATTNLAAAAYSRCLQFLASGGTAAAVLPINTLTLVSYRDWRKALLKGHAVPWCAHLGTGAFETITGEVVNVSLLACSRVVTGAASRTMAFDALHLTTAARKAIGLRQLPPVALSHAGQVASVDHRIGMSTSADASLLQDHATAHQGIVTGDVARFVHKFWEHARIGTNWTRMQSSSSTDGPYVGREHILRWEQGNGYLASSDKARIQGNGAHGSRGVSITQMSGLSAALYDGGLFDINASVLVPNDPEDLAALWSYCSSQEYRDALRRIDRKVNVTTATLAKVPFDPSMWRGKAAADFPEGLPAPFSPNPTQWLFGGSISGSEAPLHIGVGRLLGYSWPAQGDDSVRDHVDDDGVVCLASVRGEEPAADRLLALLAAAYGDRWSTPQRDALLAEVGAKGKGLDWWLQHKFFEQHCQLFQHRPFIWHLWDGIKNGGFSALINYHKLDRKLLETLTYTYLGDWIRRQQDDAARKVDGASERLDAAHRLKKSLELILEGEQPHDLFVRWKPLDQQPIGWEPDLNDGVRLNIRPFLSVPDVDKKGAGILRSKPNIHWNKDRGTDPSDAPWYDLGPAYGESQGSRINDHHLSLAEKRAAREAKR